MRQWAGWKSLPRPVRSTFDLRSGRAPANGGSHSWDAGKRVRASSPAPKRIPHPTGWGILFGMYRSTGELAASTCAKHVKSRGEAGLLRMAIAIRGMPGSEFEPRRPLQKHHPKGGVFFADLALTAVSGRHKITSQNHSAGGPPLHRQFPLFLEGFCVDITRWKSLWKLCKTQ